MNEIKVKKLQKCSKIFLSPIFKSKKKQKFLSTIKFNLTTMTEDIDYIDEIDDLGYVDDITCDIYSYNLSADNLLRILSIQVPNCSPADWYEYGVDLEELMVLIDFAKNNLDIDSSNYPLLEVDNIYELEPKLKGMLDMAVFEHKSNNLASL